MTTTSTLTDSVEVANKVLSLLFEAAAVKTTVKTGIGWRLEFTPSPLMCEIIASDTLVLEEGCDERVRSLGNPAWASADAEVERLMSSAPGCLIKVINTNQIGQLEVCFENSFELRLLPADFSPDWQWIINPLSQKAAESLSVVSVHGESIWTRYPHSLAKYLWNSGDSEFR